MINYCKSLVRIAACLSVSNKLCEKLVSSVHIISDNNHIVTSVAIFVADFNLPR